MGCEGCFDGAKYKTLDYEHIKTEAKQYAVTNQKDMAIYQESGNWLFVDVQEAISQHIPFREVVSKHP